VSTILIADDNSNIQKMVGLALKDQGIEVVAVGNGEAAVRRIPDVLPDLVLADVFMPVKNGYEVCEFVKKDQRFSHIPVILLVGAFDPLDEHEAQRVGADGVLKKPFVPPDPLISMVKAALSRSTGEPGRPRPIPIAKKVAGSPAAIPDVEATPAAAPAPLVPAGFEVEAPQEDLGIPARVESVTFEGGASPLAFGSLLETGAGGITAATPEAEEAFVAPVAHPALSDSRNWGAAPAEEEIEEEAGEDPKSSWKRDVSDEEERVAASSSGDVKDWRDFEERATDRAHAADAAPVEEAPKEAAHDFFAPEGAPEVHAEEEIPEVHGTGGGNSHATETESFYAAHVEHAAQAETELAEEEVHEPPVATEEVDSAPQIQSKAYETVFTPESYPGIFVDEKPPTKLSMQDNSAESASAFAEIASPEESVQVPNEEAPAPSLWEEQVRVAARSVAASWPSVKSEPAQAFQIETPAAEVPAVAEPGARAPEIEEEAHEPAQSYVHASQEIPPELPHREAAPEPVQQIPEQAAVAASAPQAAPDIDAVVAKVLQRLDPSIFQSVAAQLLKPVIEAIVRNEIEKKQ